jgi:hypothetical protein
MRRQRCGSSSQQAFWGQQEGRGKREGFQDRPCGESRYTRQSFCQSGFYVISTRQVRINAPSSHKTQAEQVRNRGEEVNTDRPLPRSAQRPPYPPYYLRTMYNGIGKHTISQLSF